MHKLKDIYPDNVIIDVNNPDGTFKNRISELLKGTPFDELWTADLWGFATHLLNKASIIPNGTEENINSSQIYEALDFLIKKNKDLYSQEYKGLSVDFFVSGLYGWTTVIARIVPFVNKTPGVPSNDVWRAKIFIYGTITPTTLTSYELNISGINFSALYPFQPAVSFLNSPSNAIAKNSFCIPGTNKLRFIFPSLLTSSFAISGTFRLTEKPSFVP